MTSFRQAQNWTTAMNHGTAGRRDVIAERTTKLRAVSSEGIREDIAYIIISLIVVMAVSLLLADLSALQSSSSAAGKLSSEITILENTNSSLSERLAFHAGRVRYPGIPDPENMVQIDQIETITISIPDSSPSLIPDTSGTGP